MNNPGPAAGCVVSSLTGLKYRALLSFLPESGMMMNASVPMFFRRLSGLISSDEKRVADFF
jgi:hypothetical protein